MASYLLCAIKGFWYVFLIFGVGMSVLVISVYMDIHDSQVAGEYHVKSFSCSFLKNTLDLEDQKYFKHPWYDIMVQENNSRCKT